MPPLPFRFQLEAGDVWALGADHLQGELPRLTVEDHDATAMPARRLHRHEPIPAKIPRVNNPCDLCTLRDAKVNICLRHTAQQGIKSPVPSIENIT